ncbi:ribonuclease BN (tRNA processing enzyme) [Geomicrobium halophilum]|uniref:Ribonuclease BN (tRNA processing enzyme) n=1 Tax=Geomicrobium halophilum TaxID=549000 RepID=A0A841PPX0_9BACL|nr:MBL fold metallo-hydrolase [Geomicrobium halophilum]MBB6449864.1 ribonuclease BN (tRNA processing enzyme) [Geomicrobium halophilum]
MKLTPLGVWGAYPKADEATSAFLLEEGGFRCLIDCGSGVLAKLQTHIDLHELDALVLTHYHPDHDADVGVLQHGVMIETILEKRQQPLPIYAHAQNQEKFSKLDYGKYTTVTAVSPEHKQTIGPWEVRFCETKHPVYCLALKFTNENNDSIVFTADTAWTEPLLPFIEGSELLVSEASTYHPMIDQIPGHLSGQQAGQLAEKAGVKRLLLTHLPHYGKVEDLVSEAKGVFSGEVTLANPLRSYFI